MFAKNHICQAVAIALVAFAASATAQAEQIQASVYNFNETRNVIDPIGGGDAINRAAYATINAAGFNRNLGVLTGASINLNSSATLTTTAFVSDGPDNGPNQTGTSNGTGSFQATISSPITSSTLSNITQNASCTGNLRGGCTNSSSSTPVVNHQQTAAANDLNIFATGNQSVALGARLTAFQDNAAAFTGNERTEFNARWNGSVEVIYNYLLHAAGSFSGAAAQGVLDLDFGTVFQNDVDPTLNFSIFNLANVDRIGLDFDSRSGTGNVAALSTTFSSSSSLVQGGSRLFSAMLDTMNVGSFNATYTFNLSDADIGASNTRNNSTLTLNLSGNVATRPAEVPEPFSLALLGIGLAGIAASRRRKA